MVVGVETEEATLEDDRRAEVGEIVVARGTVSHLSSNVWTILGAGISFVGGESLNGREVEVVVRIVHRAGGK